VIGPRCRRPERAVARAEAVGRRFEAACRACELKNRSESSGSSVASVQSKCAGRSRPRSDRPTAGRLAALVQLQKAWASLSAAGAIEDSLAARFTAAHLTPPGG
jgi:hypothetical protein